MGSRFGAAVVVCVSLVVGPGASGEELFPSPVIRHLPPLDGWSVAESAHFRVFHRDMPELAEKAARVAEQTRSAVLHKWFGEEDADWSAACELYLHESAAAYSQRTGVPSYSPGHSSISWTDSGRVQRRIDLHCDDPNLLTAILPHESTHVVLAGKFGKRRVPPWADEGMAVLTEPGDKIARHLQKLSQLQQEGQLFDVRDFMTWSNYPAPERIAAFYAESVGLVQFLGAAKGPRMFTQFVRDGMGGGYERSLKRHYGWDFAELERRWRRQAAADAVETAEQ